MKSFWGVFFVAQMGPISGWGSNLMLKYMMSFTDLHCKKCCAAFGLVSRSWDPWKFHMALKVWEDVTNVPSWLEGESGGGTMKWNDWIGFRCGTDKLKWRKSFSKTQFWSIRELLPQVRPSKRIFGAWCQRSGLGGRPHGSYLRPPVDEAELLLSLFRWVQAACERKTSIHQLGTKHDSVRFRLYLQELLFRILG